MSLKACAGVALYLLLSLGLAGGGAAFGADTPSVAPSAPMPAAGELQNIQDRLDTLKQQVSVTIDYAQLVSLKQLIEQLILDADLATAARLPEQLQLQTKLDVLGPAPTSGATTETVNVAQQRVALSSRKEQLQAELQELDDIKTNALTLVQQISQIRRKEVASQLTLRSGSVLGWNFWAPLFDPPLEDRQRLRAFGSQLAPAILAAWQPGQRLITVLLVLLALALCTLGRLRAEKWLTEYCIHQLPEGRLRRSGLAFAVTLCSLATVGGAFEILYSRFIQNDALVPALQSYASEVETLALTCVLMAGLCRALLSIKSPSRRLPSIANPVAVAMQPYPLILASIMLLFATVLRMSYVTGMSVQTNLLGRGLFALAITGVAGMALLRAHQTRRMMVASGNPPDAPTPLVATLYFIACAALVLSLLCLLIGYISFSTVVIYELVWCSVVLVTFYLLSQLLTDVCASLFSPKYASGKALQQFLGVEAVRLEQAEIVCAGLGRAFLLLVMVIALFVGGFGSSMGELLDDVLDMLGGEGLRTLDIVPRQLLNAVLILAIGWFLVRSLGRWLDAEFLPKTSMDPGMCISLSTLFNNIAYAIVMLLGFHALGVKWNNLAWIVSALSVGIGFGLQEIVKNFVSGLILLTERPVKVGDMVSIGSVEGDIRRINVRATEIQLNDRSIVLVPNSQLISQNLRNITTGGNAQGMAMLELTFPSDIDPEQVRTLLHEVYTEHELVLEKPAPTVRFVQMTPEGVLVRVTGFVSSPRIASNTRSELLLEILKRLKAAGVALAGAKL
jgi:small-conductance mechanosensitive channel